MITSALLAGLVLTALSGIPGLFLPRTSLAGQRTACAMMALGCGLGLLAAIASFFAAETPSLRAPWPVPGGELHVAIDGISAVFLVQIFLITLAGSIYGLTYWKQSEHVDGGRKLSCFYGLMTAAMALLVVAKNSLLFLAGWEVMALSAYLVLTTEDRDPAVAEAGFLYLCATRLGTLSLLGFFGFLYFLTGGLEITSPPISAPASAVTAAFVLALLGFGLKAGVMPLHVWLPGAHANAPSHVSAVMSGVLIKTGIYGLVRTVSIFPSAPLWWGIVLLILGVISGVLGVAFAIGQHDLKRLLAYHSVENIGIILIGLGLATMGRSLDRPDLVVLGIAGALLHVLNHGLFKALLFFSAGSVVHATGTREIDHLGGLLRKMPHTGLAFLVGAAAICGLPPLNGFVSELLIYIGLLRSLRAPEGGVVIAAALGAPALALIGALALACFVKAFGAVFLGTSRSAHTAHAHEADLPMRIPMGVLAALCGLIGLAPIALSPVLARVAAAFAPGMLRPEALLLKLAPLWNISVAGGLLLVLLSVAWLGLARRVASGPIGSTGTWDCGYAAPSATMQYTASSFAEVLVRFFGFALRPKIERPRPLSLFPEPSAFRSHVPDLVLDGLVTPVAGVVAHTFHWFRWMQAGRVHAYIVYVLIAVLALLLMR